MKHVLLCSEAYSSVEDLFEVFLDVIRRKQSRQLLLLHVGGGAPILLFRRASMHHIAGVKWWGRALPAIKLVFVSTDARQSHLAGSAADRATM